ncbi:PREDICTED: 8-oxo-dGDP phosphatase NUDT18 [Nanorana parkeri]|uniref:8-oxo-dGDP phosphatase NUDT18 n=1 Tax=Nanorana parkeri TaxID=125878 RepID=UPI000854F05A|nr:PREDICTED: 8-oxo-dGDP phosphatase NUDT18 [Nanorana parkeri]XP_018425721.1 PREDICTED: 8-oxo-dGDP phosphatase NUDT18 [Nanorana parkeri]
MSSGLEEELKTLLVGGVAPLPDTYDMMPESPRPLKLRHNVCYIVMGVILNDQDEVLMMQEAKTECLGTWYTPAGRLERGETLVDGLCREVKEETGLTCEPITLLAVEERGAAWVRFVFLAQHTGGTLKSPASADKESLQASWWDRVSPLPLRCRDILPLLKLALEYRHQPSHPHILPQLYPSPFLILRMFLVCSTKPEELWVLRSASVPARLPAAVCSTHGGSILNPLRNLLQDPPKAYGILGVQHLGGDGEDGICLTVMGVFSGPEPPQVRVDSLSWVLVEDEELKSSIKKATLLPLYS